MKCLLTFLLILLCSTNVCIAQQMPIDFSYSSDAFTAFGGSGFSFNSDPLDSNNEVGQFFNDGSQSWQGFFIELEQPVDLSLQQVLTLSFYAFDPNAHTIRIKLENGNNSAPDIEVVKGTSSSGWTTNISFDFSNATISGSTNVINANGTYNKLVIFIDGGVSTPGTYLIDDINDGSIPEDPNELDVIYTELVWQDEFEVDGAVNNDNWFLQTQLPGGGSWFNGEEQHYTNRLENSFVNDGFLNIVAIKENFSDQGQTKSYTSARLNSKFAFTYGRVDVRAKLPFGDGTWPAIWTLGKNINEDGAYWENQGFGTVNWPDCGEIDIMEHGLGPVNHTSSAIHTPSSSGNTVNVASQEISDVANNFHIYSVNWSPNQITFLVDGVGFYTYNPAVKNDSNWPFYREQYLLLNIAMGGIAGAIDLNFTQSSMLIDYVRVYQNTLSVADNDLLELNVFPNPAKNSFRINSASNLDKMELYNVLGILCMSKSEFHEDIDITSLPSGIYLMKIYSENRLVSKKLIIN